jgi:hypothetical protein
VRRVVCVVLWYKSYIETVFSLGFSVLSAYNFAIAVMYLLVLLMRDGQWAR